MNVRGGLRIRATERRCALAENWVWLHHPSCKQPTLKSPSCDWHHWKCQAEVSFVCLPLLSANTSTPSWKKSPHIRVTAAGSDRQVFLATRTNHLIAGCWFFLKTCWLYSVLVPYEWLIQGFKEILHPFYSSSCCSKTIWLIQIVKFWRIFQLLSYTRLKWMMGCQALKRIIKVVFITLIIHFMMF